MTRRWALLWPLLQAATVLSISSSFASCGEETCRDRVVETDESCTTSEQCVEAGYTGLVCVNGTCGKTCVGDSDCAALAQISQDDKDRCPNLLGVTPPIFICERQLCTNGCVSNADCASGDTCLDGRCSLYAESWEPRGNGIISPEAIGWNNDERELENVETKVVFEGLEGCARGDEKCAGPAATGSYFVSLERTPTPAQSTPLVTDTCRACACCLQCKLSPPAAQLDILGCPDLSIDVPANAMCPASTPAVCTNVCSACDDCAAAPATRVVSPELSSCEGQAARKTCTACSVECQEGQPCPPAACTACRDAELCDLETPGVARCNALHAACDAQGADGCYSTPVARPRSLLTDLEQSLTSSVIPLVNAGEVILELEYVPFDIGEKYRRVVQGTEPATWPIETQEVLVQLCGGNCTSDSSWVTALTLSGSTASLPSDPERNNGVRLGAQSVIDWRSNRAQIAIPENFRTSEFRFRFLPKLADNARFGIDNIVIRRRSP
jgi:hypothetical protein